MPKSIISLLIKKKPVKIRNDRLNNKETDENHLKIYQCKYTRLENNFV